MEHIKLGLPAHIVPNVIWVSLDDMIYFENIMLNYFKHSNKSADQQFKELQKILSFFKLKLEIVKAQINHVLFEIETNIPVEKIDFFEVLRVIFYNEVIKLLEDYFDSFPEDTNMSIDRLEIDLNDFLIESSDLDSFTLKFTERFKSKLIDKGLSVKYFREAQMINPIEIIKEFLTKGYTSKRFILIIMMFQSFFYP